MVLKLEKVEADKQLPFNLTQTMQGYGKGRSYMPITYYLNTL